MSTSTPMNICVLGAGRVGSTLGGRLLDAGHRILYAVRTPDDPKYAPLRDSGAQVLSIPAAVEGAQLVILATPWAAAQAAIEAAGDFGGKPLLDATNPIGPGGVLTHGHTDSGGEQVQRWASTAKVVKVFNTTGRENMADPVYPAGRAAMFLCGDDDEACESARILCEDLGFEAVRVGKLDRARWIEPLALVWIGLARTPGHGRQFALGMMRRPES